MAKPKKNMLTKGTPYSIVVFLTISFLTSLSLRPPDQGLLGRPDENGKRLCHIVSSESRRFYERKLERVRFAPAHTGENRLSRAWVRE